MDSSESSDPFTVGPQLTPGRASLSQKNRSNHCCSTVCEASRKPRTANAKCSWGFCQECCLAGQPCSLSSHSNRTPTPARMPTRTPTQAADPFSGPYARMIPEEYRQTLRTGDFNRTPRPSLAAAYKEAQKTTINVMLWTSDILPPTPYRLVVPPETFPFFHPNEHKEITQMVGPIESFLHLSATPQLPLMTEEAQDLWVVQSTHIK
ncbi:hypothetical protein K438DRAFT_979665 [Mycena galopus ATCC 62051]|nr:hypothetical protein K438DRAFT_979665 [Mycena galopus ATCC 62051]